MGEIIDMGTARDVMTDAAFADYVAAKNRADQTLRILDMMAAARAWEKFVLLALPNPRERIGLL